MTMQHWRLPAGLVAGMVLLCGPSLRAQGAGPSGATAKCRDGVYSHARYQTEACRDHGGQAVWYGMASHDSVVAARRMSVYDSLEVQIARQNPNIVLRADLAGKMQDTVTADSLELAHYPTFMEYLDHTRQASGCRKVSDHCALCPTSRQIYCTNVAQYLPLMAF